MSHHIDSYINEYADRRRLNDEIAAAWEIEHMEQALRNGIQEPGGFIVDGFDINTIIAEPFNF